MMNGRRWQVERLRSCFAGPPVRASCSAANPNEEEQMPVAKSGATLDTIAQIALTVSDLERSVAFYRDALGMPLLFQAPPGLAFFSCGAIRLMLSTPEKDFKPGGSSVLYFKVSGIEAVHAALKGKGVPFVDEPHFITKMPTHDLWMTFFRDPDGNTIALMEEKKAG
jgi:methylmalonyl-CoA/ethylmalonyl-CoA epimerase